MFPVSQDLINCFQQLGCLFFDLFPKGLEVGVTHQQKKPGRVVVFITHLKTPFDQHNRLYHITSSTIYNHPLVTLVCVRYENKFPLTPTVWEHTRTHTYTHTHPCLSSLVVPDHPISSPSSPYVVPVNVINLLRSVALQAPRYNISGRKLEG